MTDPTRGRLEGLLAPPGILDETGRSRWHAMRRRAAQRHAHWRAGMPAIEALFDDEVHRAKALAGNLATELGDVLRGTARIAPGAIVDRDEPAEWLVVSCRTWRAGLRGAELVGEDGPAAVEMFDAMLEELIARERARAVEEAVADAADRPAERGVLGRLTDGMVAALRRFFRPA